MLRTILIGAFVIGIAYVAITYNNLWVDNSTLKEDKRSLTSTLADTKELLQQSRESNGGLLQQITGLFSTTATLNGIIDGYKVRDANTSKRVYQKQAEQQLTDQQISADVGAMSTAEQMKAANRPIAGFGTVPSTDSGKVAHILGLKKVIADRDTTIIVQRIEINTQTSRADDEHERAEKFRKDKSALEDELNGKSNADADRIEAANNAKYFLSIGRKAANQKAANDIRAGRVKKPVTN